MTADLRGRRVVVTGGSMGIGLELSHELARRQAKLVIVARGAEALRTAAELAGDGHHGLRFDVSDREAWSAAMPEIDGWGPVHGLVTAAGVLGPIGALEELDPREFARTIEVNLIGTMLALHHVLPRLRATSGRAVTLSGGGATTPLPRYDAYATSKAAVVRLTENLAARGEVEINCIAPGFVATRMHEGTLSAGRDAAGAQYYEQTQAQLARGGFAASEAAELACMLLSERARGITGRLISAQWDPWREQEFLDRLRADGSLATLRRIDGQFFSSGRAPEPSPE